KLTRALSFMSTPRATWTATCAPRWSKIPRRHVTAIAADHRVRPRSRARPSSITLRAPRNARPAAGIEGASFPSGPCIPGARRASLPAWAEVTDDDPLVLLLVRPRSPDRPRDRRCAVDRRLRGHPEPAPAAGARAQPGRTPRADGLG